MNANEMNEIEILQKIGARMREIRLEQNMKQKELWKRDTILRYKVWCRCSRPSIASI